MKARDGLVVNLWTPLLFPWLPDPLGHTYFLQPLVPTDFTMPLAGLNAIFCLSWIIIVNLLLFFPHQNALFQPITQIQVTVSPNLFVA